MALDPHPNPPSDWARLEPLIRKFRRAWFRIHRTMHEPMFFGRSGANRFDAPREEFGVLYAAADARGSFIETMGRLPAHRLVPWAEISARGLAKITPKRALRLVDLTSEGLARIGADSRLTSGDSYDLSQRWILALHEHPEKPDGIVYRSRHDPSRLCAALFDRIAPDLDVEKLGTLAAPDHTKLLASILNRYDFGLV
ncbi:RES family NAD+ phosphorylase [Chondromyces crocatus]|uniref:RES domain-containing protein n=1 Tax=Chondromyces crocatus TaxID=52 RepID=A0A0K1EMX6_CHOCO|nr:RES family NAD+ phosphorylase [Chondromyces crocatus]AKT42250.1 uncharacterized protein CMC5_064730 [Chondromyces crocatus]